MMHRSVLSCALTLCTLGLPADTWARVDDCPRTDDMPRGYRMEHYRRPTPPCAPGAITLETKEVIELIASNTGLLLFDVGALLLRTEPGFGSEWLPTEIHMSLPGAIWLPNVGKGKPSPVIADWFVAKLQSLTGGDLDHPMMFFCVADCWMSWNASIRARELGYRKVYWYRDGTSGWTESGLELVAVDPENI